MQWNGKPLTIGHFTARVPIVQGGMGIGISLSGLAAAVANAGGIGVISAAGIGMAEPDYTSNFLEANLRALRAEIRKARSMTKGILGVNIMVAMNHFGEIVKTVLEENIDIIFVGAGIPLTLPSYLEANSHTKLVPIVSSAKAAGLIAKRWLDKYNYAPDGFVLEGPLAGGHLGFSEEQLDDPNYQLEKLVPEVVAEAKKVEERAGKHIPVIAGGGVYTGADIHRILELGASGVQMATRFVTTHECDASPGFKQTYIHCQPEDIGIIKSPVGMPGRAIVNAFVEDVRKGIKRPVVCPYHCIITCKEESSPYCITLALMNAKKGRMQHGFAFAGANAWRAEKIVSVQELIDTLTQEYNEARAH